MMARTWICDACKKPLTDETRNQLTIQNIYIGPTQIDLCRDDLIAAFGALANVEALASWTAEMGE